MGIWIQNGVAIFQNGPDKRLVSLLLNNGIIDVDITTQEVENIAIMQYCKFEMNGIFQKNSTH